MISADKWLKGRAEWSVPTAGMFVWIKCKNMFIIIPLVLGIDDSSILIKEKAVKKGVLFVPGIEFLPNSRPTPFIRAAYSTASPEEIDIALSRLATLLDEKE